MKVRWQYLVLAGLLCWALTAQLSFSIFAINRYINRHQNLDLPFVRENSSTIIGRIPRQYRGSGLQRRDDVLALDGQNANGREIFENYPYHLHPGQVLTVRVRRSVAGRPQTIDVPVQMQPLRQESLDWASLLGLQIVLPISCLLVGFYIAFACPSDPIAWITMAMLASFGNIAYNADSWGIPSPWREFLLIYHPLLSNSWPLWLVLFGLYFPKPTEFVKRNRWIAAALSAPTSILYVLDVYGNFAMGRHMRENHWLAAVFASINTPVTWLFTVYVWGFFVMLSVNRRKISNSDSRRRMLVMIYGCTLALLPLFPVVLSQVGIVPHIPDWIQTCLLLMLLIFPATMAYVIVVQRAMDVRMVVRSGVQYAIGNHFIRALQLLLTAALVLLTSNLARNSAHAGEAVVIGCLGAALIFGLRRLALRANKWMDRRFFREAYNAEMILTELSNSVATIRDVPLLVQTIARRIADSLHVDRVAVLLGHGEVFQPVYSIGFNGLLPSNFSPSKTTLSTMRGMGPSARVYFDDPQSWVHGTPEADQLALQQMDSQLLLPVTRKSRLLGLISLGPKRSEAPYTREDLQLLGALASQTGLALENAELTENIRVEVAARERVNRELEIAREVQQRLFPQTLPVIKGLDLAGYCRPALEVGGDYYDFIRLPSNGLGIAIGDVSGKGIAAALMMASLQACLRGQSLNASMKIAQLMTNINSLIFEASAANRYATFFYAQYDPGTRRLQYVNAGHNAPVIYRRRAGSSEFLRLEEGGMVIGLFPSVAFVEGDITLQQGDVLLAFTDGFSEAMDKRDLEYGEERLMETLQSCTDESAEETIQKLLQEVDFFTAGAPQHDDMTLVVVRVQ